MSGDTSAAMEPPMLGPSKASEKHRVSGGKSRRSKSQTRSNMKANSSGRRRSSSVTPQKKERRTHSLDASRTRRKRASYQDLSTDCHELPSPKSKTSSSHKPKKTNKESSTSTSTSTSTTTRYKKMSSKDKMSAKAREILASSSTATSDSKPGLSDALTGTSSTSLSTSVSSKRSSNSKKNTNGKTSHTKTAKTKTKTNNNSNNDKTSNTTKQQQRSRSKSKTRQRSRSKSRTRRRSRSISVNLRKGKRSSAKETTTKPVDNVSLLEDLSLQLEDEHIRRPSLDMSSIHPQLLQNLAKEDAKEQKRMGMSLSAMDASSYSRDSLLQELRADKSSRSARRASAARSRETSVERADTAPTTPLKSSLTITPEPKRQQQSTGESSREDRSLSPDPLPDTSSNDTNVTPEKNEDFSDLSGRTEVSTPSPELSKKVRKATNRGRTSKRSSAKYPSTPTDLDESAAEPVSPTKPPLRLSIRESPSFESLNQSIHSATPFLRRSTRDTPSILRDDPLSQSIHSAAPVLRKSARDTPSIRQYEKPSLHRSLTLPDEVTDQHHSSPVGSQSAHVNSVRRSIHKVSSDESSSSSVSSGSYHARRRTLDRASTMPEETTQHDNSSAHSSRSCRLDKSARVARLSDHLGSSSNHRRPTRRSDRSVSSRSETASRRRRTCQLKDEPPPLMNSSDHSQQSKKGRRHSSPVPIKSWNSLVNPTPSGSGPSVSSASCESSYHSKSSHHQRSFLPKHLSTNNPLHNSFSTLVSRHSVVEPDSEDIFQQMELKSKTASKPTRTPATPSSPNRSAKRVQFEDTPDTHILEDDSTREWYSTDDVAKLMEQEMAIVTAARTCESLEMCTRGLEHVLDKIDKEKKNREHVMSIRLKQFTLRTKQKKGEDLDLYEEVRNYSRARTKEDRKRAFLLGQQDAKFVINETNAERDQEAKIEENSLRSSHHSGSMGQMVTAAATRASKKVSTARSNASRLVSSAVIGASEILGQKRTEKASVAPRFGDAKFGRLASSKNLMVED